MKRNLSNEKDIIEPPPVRAMVSLSSAFATRRRPIKTKSFAKEADREEPTKGVSGADKTTSDTIRSPKNMDGCSDVVASAMAAYSRNACSVPKGKKPGQWYVWTKPDAAGTSTRTRSDRFNFPGSACVNELVLRNVAASKQPDQPSRSIRRVLTPAVTRKNGSGAVGSPDLISVPRGPLKLDRTLFNLVRTLVHPLHNFLQQSHGLHNEDELQVMLIPAATTAAASGPGATTVRRRGYVATNQESLTQGTLDNATKDWGVLSTLRIDSLEVVHGEKGRHAEQKLIDYFMKLTATRAKALRSRVRGISGDGWDSSLAVDFKGVASSEASSVVVVGERLPCAACRLYAAVTGADRHLAILPSHGHMYLSTLDRTPYVGSLSPEAALDILNGGGDQ